MSLLKSVFYLRDEVEKFTKSFFGGGGTDGRMCWVDFTAKLGKFFAECAEEEYAGVEEVFSVCCRARRWRRFSRMCWWCFYRRVREVFREVLWMMCTHVEFGACQVEFGAY